MVAIPFRPVVLDPAFRADVGGSPRAADSTAILGDAEVVSQLEILGSGRPNRGVVVRVHRAFMELGVTP